MLDPDDPNVRQATLGTIIENFLATPVGAYLEAKARNEEVEALEALRTVDAEDPKEVRKFQNQALVAGKIIEWLAIAIHEGEMSLQTLKDEYDGD